MGSSKRPNTARMAQLIKDQKAPYDPYAIPRAEIDQAQLVRDRMRRVALRAGGRDSTVRTGPGGAPYSAAPKQLLGS